MQHLVEAVAELAEIIGELHGVDTHYAERLGEIERKIGLARLEVQEDTTYELVKAREQRAADGAFDAE